MLIPGTLDAVNFNDNCAVKQRRRLKGFGEDLIPHCLGDVSPMHESAATGRQYRKSQLSQMVLLRGVSCGVFKRDGKLPVTALRPFLERPVFACVVASQ
eukprot:11826894-Ditylum_brightwellii.AAC.1